MNIRVTCVPEKERIFCICFKVKERRIGDAGCIQRTGAEAKRMDALAYVMRYLSGL